MKLAVALIGAFSLSACVESTGADSTNAGPVSLKTDWLTGNTYADNAGRFIFGADYPRADVTYASADIFHGLQIEYFSPQGKAYLWYPGNTRVVVGDWKDEGRKICFRYQSNSSNPVTGQTGGEWECQGKISAQSDLVSSVDGDAFGLTSGRLPVHDLRTCRLPGDMQMVTMMRCLPKG